MVQPVDVAKLRKRLGWSREFLAEHLGIAPASVARWERGVQKPSREAASQLYQLWLLAKKEDKAKPGRRRAAAPGDMGATHIQRIGGTSYRTKAFRLGPPADVCFGGKPGEGPEALDNTSPPPEGDVASAFPTLAEDKEAVPRSVPERSYAPPYRPSEGPSQEERQDFPRPKSKRRFLGLPIKVGMVVAVALFLLFGTLSAAGASSVGLSPNLPELLTKVFPHLELFVMDVEKDLIAIGKAYREPGPKPTPSAGPQQSLEDLLKSVSDVNEQLGPEASDRGLFAEIIKLFRQNREEAWQRATSGR